MIVKASFWLSVKTALDETPLLPRWIPLEAFTAKKSLHKHTHAHRNYNILNSYKELKIKKNTQHLCSRIERNAKSCLPKLSTRYIFHFCWNSTGARQDCWRIVFVEKNEAENKNWTVFTPSILTPLVIVEQHPFKQCEQAAIKTHRPQDTNEEDQVLRFKAWNYWKKVHSSSQWKSCFFYNKQK